ncbi:MAG: hypothetical protein P8P98_00160 [Emcibacteraceae bacterium]|nr:hypothetical protein [Emcibacteraceae bacterium]MDG1996593.1 hypothetical protein [Emcibacteraceae bacterium]
MTSLTDTYNFMDLLRDKGHVPERAEESILLEIESGLHSIVEFVEETTMDYDFLDLVMEKGAVAQLVPVAANDNAYLREAS